MRTILLIFAFLLFEHALHAQQPIDAMPDRTRKRVEILIEQLASRNNTPPILGNARRGEDQTIRFPESYDKSRQVRSTPMSTITSLWEKRVAQLPKRC